MYGNENFTNALHVVLIDFSCQYYVFLLSMVYDMSLIKSARLVILKLSIHGSLLVELHPSFCVMTLDGLSIQWVMCHINIYP